LVDFATTETQDDMVAAAGTFGREVWGPAERTLDALSVDDLPFETDVFTEAMAKAFALGLHKMDVREELGGLGLDASTTGMVWEELARHGAGLTASLMAGGVVPGLVGYLAADDQALVDRYVLPYTADTTGTHLTGWGSSEPNIGSDGKNYYDTTVRHALKAERTSNGFVLNGAKSGFVSNGGIARTLIVFACLEPELGIRGSGAFIVPGDAPGLSRGKTEDRVGLRALNQATVYCDDVEIPDDHMIFPPGNTYPDLHNAILTVGNLGTGYLAVGLMRAAFEDALAFAKERVQWGKPIIEHQLVGRKMFEAHAAIETARALLWKGSWHTAQQFPGDLTTSLTAKIYATEEAALHTGEMMQVLGGYGLTREYPVEKYVRDAAMLRVMDGTNDTLMLKAVELLAG
jgi:alkylation response protein AidB-like acyl-CoA dehydrogenase